TSHDLGTEEKAVPNPLIAASAAIALAAVEMPAAIAGGALAVATLPILARAVKGLKSGCLITEQLDLLTIGTLAARGNFLGGSTMTWLIGLSDMLRGRSALQARRAVGPTIGASHLDAKEEKTAERIIQRIRHAPLSNTHLHNDANEKSSRFSVPLAVMATVQFIASRNPIDAVGILKPRCEFEATTDKI